MIRDPNSDVRRTRLILLLVGVFGLAGSAAIYFACMNSHPHESNEAIRPANTAPASAVASTQPRSFGITNVTVPDMPGAAPSQTVAPATSADAVGVAPAAGTISDTGAAVAMPKPNKHRSRANRNRIASRIPGMDRMPGPNFHSPLPPGQVEMWSGTKKSVVEVDPGTKFED
jgi:hypothetical protein